MNKDRRILLCVLGVSLLLKLAFWGYAVISAPQIFFTHDSPRYHQNALSLLKVGSFAQSPELPDKPETLRTPGYPFFLAVVYSIFGDDPSTVIALQIVISIASLILIYGIAHQLWGSRIAILAVTLSALDVGLFAFSLLFMTETLFTLLILCMLAALVPLFRGEEPRKWSLLAGLFLGLATLVRPVGYYLGFPLMIGLLTFGMIGRPSFKPIGVLFCFCGAFLLITGSWQFRNYLLTGHPELSMQRGQLLVSKAAEVLAMKEHIKVKTARLRISEGSGKGQWEEGGFHYLKEYPLFYLRKVLERSYRVFVPSGFAIFRFFNEGVTIRPIRDLSKLSREAYFRKWAIDHPAILALYIFMCAHLMLLYLAGAFGFIHAWKNNPGREVHILFGLVLLYFLAVSLAIGFRPRFLLPALPILSLYAARGLAVMLKVNHSVK